MAGSVTNPTGSVNGKSLAGLVDAETYFSGITEPIGSTMAQWQAAATLTDKAGICGRFVGGMQTYLAGELTLRMVVTGWKEAPSSAPWAPPAGDLPLTLPVVDPPVGYTDTSDGVHRILRVYFMQAGKNGRAGSDTAATSGTVTYTAVDSTDPDQGQSGSYDLYFGTSHVTGSFVAPRCFGA